MREESEALVLDPLLASPKFLLLEFGGDVSVFGGTEGTAFCFGITFVFFEKLPSLEELGSLFLQRIRQTNAVPVGIEIFCVTRYQNGFVCFSRCPYNGVWQADAMLTA